MAQIDVAVAVVVDAVLDVGRGQELGLADLAGKGALEIAQRQVAALQDFQRGDQLALEQFGAAAIMRQRRQRADHRQLAHVAGAVVAFHGPDRHQQRARHAELPLDAREQRGVLRHQPLGAGDARRDDAGRGIALEAHAEGAVLAAVEGEHRRIGRDAGKGWSITLREMPAACASRAIWPRKAWKSPPHGAARAGSGEEEEERCANERNGRFMRPASPLRSFPRKAGMSRATAAASETWPF